MLSDDVKGNGAWCDRMTNEGERCVNVIVLGCVGRGLEGVRAGRGRGRRGRESETHPEAGRLGARVEQAQVELGREDVEPVHLYGRRRRRGVSLGP